MGGILEDELYSPVRDWMASPEFTPARQSAAHSKRFGRAYVTADLHWLLDAGEWMRPDVTMVDVRRRKFDTVPRLDVHAVEVKPKNQSLISGLFQSLSYSRIADFCYLAAPCSANWHPRITEVAQRFGVGTIKFSDPDRWDSYELVLGDRMTPDADLRDEFISAVLQNPADRIEFLNFIEPSK